MHAAVVLRGVVLVLREVSLELALDAVVVRSVLKLHGGVLRTHRLVVTLVKLSVLINSLIVTHAVLVLHIYDGR